MLLANLIATFDVDFIKRTWNTDIILDWQGI